MMKDDLLRANNDGNRVDPIDGFSLHFELWISEHLLNSHPEEVIPT